MLEKISFYTSTVPNNIAPSSTSIHPIDSKSNFITTDRADERVPRKRASLVHKAWPDLQTLILKGKVRMIFPIIPLETFIK